MSEIGPGANSHERLGGLARSLTDLDEGKTGVISERETIH